MGQEVQPGRAVTVGLRPEHLRIDQNAAQFQLPIRVVESTGSLTYVTTDTDPELMVVEQGRSRYRAGEVLPLSIAPDDIHLFDTNTDTAL
jgi:multiple sugar transport system ATP-binding protein